MKEFTEFSITESGGTVCWLQERDHRVLRSDTRIRNGFRFRVLGFTSYAGLPCRPQESLAAVAAQQKNKIDHGPLAVPHFEP